MLSSGGSSLVEEVRVEDVNVGDIIWAPRDNAWFTVADMEARTAWGTEFYRRDGSVADFDYDATVLKRKP